MKKFSLLFIVFLIFSQSKSQQELTLKKAVLEQWGSLNPERLSNLKWNNETDFFSYHFSDTSIYICDYNFNVIDTIFLNQINVSFDGEEKIKRLPNINWINSHTFRFKHNNNYYLYNIKRGHNSSLLFSLDREAMNIDFNSQNNYCAYTNKNNLYVVNNNNQHIQITNEDNKNIVFGQAVHRYEFGISKGTFWSNDGKKLAFYRKDETMVTDYPLMNISSRVGHTDIIKYPMAGMSSHHVTVGIYNSENSEIIYLQTGEPKEQYLTNIAWGPNDKYIYIAVLNRDQNHLQLNQYSATDGSFIKTLFEEKSDKYVEPLDPMKFIDNNKFLWLSERDGYYTFYLYNTKGKMIKRLLNKDYVVKDYYGHDDDIIYFSTYTKDGLGIDLWVVSIKKKYRKKIVTDSNYHNFKISPTKSYFIDEFSNTNLPRKIRILNNKGNEVVTLLKSSNPLEDYNIGELNLLKIKNKNNIDLNARLIKPYDFDPSKKYPVLIYVYNGPHVQLINNRWLGGARLWMYYLANQGYIVFSLDGRGSDNRGRDFEQVIFRELGKFEMLDQITGYNYLIDQDFVDSSRIAIHGWSYGGYMTTNLLLNYPKYFTCGVAGGPVTNWSSYEVMYTERYMDHPENNKEGYMNTNLMNKLDSLDTPLLMIHGLIDDVVLPKHSLDFIKTAVDKNIQMDYFIYPGHPHNVRGKDRLHLIEKIIDYIRVNNN